MTAPPEGERRQHERHPVSLPARLTLVGLTIEGRLEDVGAGGVRFATDDTLLKVQPGNFVQIAFECTRDGVAVTIDRAVRVSWVLPVAALPSDDADVPKRVVGLEFEEILALADLTLAS